MKTVVISTLFCFLMRTAVAQDFNLDSIYAKYKATDTAVYVYMTALWCAPCLDKMPLLDAYFTSGRNPFKLYYLFDRDKFSWRRLSQIFPHIDFRNRITLMPQRFYPTGMLQVNGHHKMFRNFIVAHKGFRPEIKALDSFTLASLLVIPPLENPLVINPPDFRKYTLGQLDSLFQFKQWVKQYTTSE